MKKLILLLFLVVTANAFAQKAAVIQGGVNIKLFKDNLKFKSANMLILTNDTDDPSSVAKLADRSSLYLRKGVGELYIKTTNDTSSTNWEKFVSGLVSLTADVTGILPIANGGTNSSTALGDGKVMISVGGAIVEATDLQYVDATDVMTLTGQLNVDDTRLDGNTLSSTTGNLNLTPLAPNDIVMSLAGETYTFSDSGAGRFSLQRGTAAAGFQFELFSGDSDGTDNTRLMVFGSGQPEAANADYQEMGLDTGDGEFYHRSSIAGTGVLRPLKIEVGANTDQLKLATDGSLSTSGNLNLEATKEVRFQDTAGGEYMGFKAPGTVTASTTLTLPDGDGTANQVIKTDGAGNLDWVDNTTAAVIDKASSQNSTGSGTLNNATEYYLDFVTSDFDDDSNFTGCGSGHVTTSATGCRYVVPTNGVYIIVQKVQFSGADLDADETILLQTKIDDVSDCTQEYRHDLSSGATFRRVIQNICVSKLTAGDIIEASFYQETGVGITLTTGSASGSFDVIRVDQPGGALSTTYHASVSGTEVITNDAFTYLGSCTNADPSVCTFTGSFFANTPACWSSEGFPVTVSGTTSAAIDRTDAATAFTLICNEAN